MKKLLYLFTAAILLFASCSTPVSTGEGDSGEQDGELNTIYYTTTDGKKLFPKTDAILYGAILVSNTYKDGQGVLVFDDAVTLIGVEAFRNCKTLASVAIPNSVVSIGDSAFRDCSGLTSVTIGKGVAFIGNSAFDGCTGELTVNCNIPDASSSSAGAFCGSKFTKITIGKGVTSIGAYAFYHCSSLVSVTIPDSVTSIGFEAFCGCTGELIVNCNIPIAENYSYGAFDHSRFTKVVIGDGVTSIGSYAFNGCSSLATITIPDSVTEIGTWAFSGCSSLKEVDIFDIATWCSINFGSNPLIYAHNLYLNGELVTDLVIPDSVTSIGSRAFSDCTSLASVTIPNSVTEIGIGAFSGCSGLTEFNGKFASNDVKSLIIDGVLNAFAPAGLTTYAIPDSVTSIGESAFYGCSSLVSVTIPDSVTSIGESAFYGCSSLVSVTIPDSVTSIGTWAFGYCSSITSIIIPSNVSSIGYYSLYYCTNLADVYCRPTTPPSVGYDVFDYNALGRKIYVPTESVVAYKSAENWSNYSSDIVGYDF